MVCLRAPCNKLLIQKKNPMDKDIPLDLSLFHTISMDFHLKYELHVVIRKTQSLAIQTRTEVIVYKSPAFML